MADYPNASGYVMSTTQLRDLWHYDMWLGNCLMDLPLRTCTAIPKDLPNFPPMESGDFQRLKNQVRSMWITASHIFTAKKGDFGWGLFFSDDYTNNGRIFSEKNPLVLGWLARVPSPDMCPTGHKYLRSPCGEDKFPLYLGGPISMANYDQVDRVICKRFISDNEPKKNKMGVFKAPRRKISTECCSELQQNGMFSMPSVVIEEEVDGSDNFQSAKRAKRKVGGKRPHVKTACITSFKPCTYCGVNVASALESGKKINLKCHWALKHFVNLCHEMDAEEDSSTNPKDFIRHLDKVDQVFNTLNSHNYKIVPACMFFQLTDTPLLPPEASSEEKAAAFNKFLDEGRSAFKRYQVIYLNGINIPQRYEDLLKPDRYYNYDDVNWETEKPSGNNFSLARYNLTDEENQAHSLDIKTHLTNAVVGWM